jgi:dTDP-glucose 4,6-dehydratase
MRIVVTGGSGFIGSAVCRHLVSERGATVLDLDRLEPSWALASLSEIATSPRFVFRKGDICNASRVSALLAAFSPDAIIHTAAARSSDDSTQSIVTGINGTWRLLEAARAYWQRMPESRRDAFRLVHISAGLPKTERPGVVAPMRFSPHHDTAALNAAGRIAADSLALAWQRSFGLPVMVAQSAPCIGPFEPLGGLVPRTVVSALEGRRIEIEYPEDEVVDWLHVDDMVRALDAILRAGNPGETYTIGGASRRTMRAVVERTVELVDRQSPSAAGTRKGLIQSVRFADAGLADPLPHCDISALKRDTGWQPELGFDAALVRTVRWYLDNAWWWRPLRDAEDTSSRREQLRIA